MHAIRSRLAKLEKQAGIANSPGMYVVVKSFNQDDDIDGLLASRGIDPEDPRHQVVILQTLFENRDGSIAPVREPARILHLQPR